MRGLSTFLLFALMVISARGMAVSCNVEFTGKISDLTHYKTSGGLFTLGRVVPGKTLVWIGAEGKDISISERGADGRSVKSIAVIDYFLHFSLDPANPSEKEMLDTLRTATASNKEISVMAIENGPRCEARSISILNAELHGVQWVKLRP